MPVYLVSQYRGVRRKLVKQQPIKQYSIEKALEAFKVIHGDSIRHSDMLECTTIPVRLLRSR